MWWLRRFRIRIQAMVGQSKWSLKKRKVSVCPLLEESLLSSTYSVIMNLIVWNYRGALKSNFQDYVHDLVRQHDPAIFVVTETHIGGALECTDAAPEVPHPRPTRHDAGRGVRRGCLRVGPRLGFFFFFFFFLGFAPTRLDSRRCGSIRAESG